MHQIEESCIEAGAAKVFGRDFSNKMEIYCGSDPQTSIDLHSVPDLPRPADLLENSTPLRGDVVTKQ